jgi:hypothetical protein
MSYSSAKNIVSHIGGLEESASDWKRIRYAPPGSAIQWDRRCTGSNNKARPASRAANPGFLRLNSRAMQWSNPSVPPQQSKQNQGKMRHGSSSNQPPRRVPLQNAETKRLTKQLSSVRQVKVDTLVAKRIREVAEDLPMSESAKIIIPTRRHVYGREDHFTHVKGHCLPREGGTGYVLQHG